MLILQRKKDESIILNKNIKLSVIDIGTDWVKLAIDAPKDVKILRSELVEAAKVNQEASSLNDNSVQVLKKLLNK